MYSFFVPVCKTHRGPLSEMALALGMDRTEWRLTHRRNALGDWWGIRVSGPRTRPAWTTILAQPQMLRPDNELHTVSRRSDWHGSRSTPRPGARRLPTGSRTEPLTHSGMGRPSRILGSTTPIRVGRARSEALRSTGLQSHTLCEVRSMLESNQSSFPQSLGYKNGVLFKDAKGKAQP